MIREANMRTRRKNLESVDDNKSSNKKPYVLVVEDDALTRKYDLKILEDLNCNVELAVTGKEALEKCHKDFDLIFLDCGLPDIDGLEVCKQIRRREKYINRQPTPIIMLSAFIEEELKPQCKLAGISELVIKPIVEIEQWELLLQKWLLNKNLHKEIVIHEY